MTKRVYLIGYMGSGKSTMGRLIAKAKNWNFIDLDAFIENKYHKSISTIFKEYGEDYFREIETSCLKEISTIEDVIIGAGGGTPCFFNNIELMNSTGLCIYLKLSPQIIFNRLINASNKRPLIKGKSEEELLNFIKKNLTERQPYYKKAQIIADANNWSVNDFTNTIDNTN